MSDLHDSTSVRDIDESTATSNFKHTFPVSGKYAFEQLFDIAEVQKIQDAFSKATGVASIITDIDGTPITKPSGFSFFCNEIIRKTEKGLCNCMKSDAILGTPHSGGPRMQRCLSGGLLDGGTSIIVGSHHVANWLIGQILDEETDINEMYKYCFDIGADFDTYKEALEKVTKMPKERFLDICNFLYLNAMMLSSQAVKNILQQEEIIKRMQTEEKYRLLFENAVEAIIIVQDGFIKMCNPMGVALTGYSVEELMSIHVNNFIHPDDRKSITLNYLKRAFRENEDNRYHFRVQMKDGTFKWVEMNTIAYVWEKKPATLNFIADITQRKRTEDALRLSEEKYRLLTEFASDVIWVLNLSKNKFTYISPSILHLRGITVDEALQESLEESLTPQSFSIAAAHLEKGVRELIDNPDNQNSYVNEIQQPCKNGEVIWTEVSTKFRRNADDEIEVVGVSRNIEKRKTTETEILYLSYRDQLTGLANRRFYEDELKRIDNAKNMPLALIMIDVNGLKLTNDAFSHNFGDLLLIKAANILKSVCRASDSACRIGGDEFVLLLPCCNAEAADHIVTRITKAIASEKLENIILSASIGYAVKENASQNINDIFREAEDQMYKNKLNESSGMRSKTIDFIMNTLYEKYNREMLHSKRVSELCEAIAVKMDFDKDDINQIRMAGLMHDIGKIGIDEQILNKSSKLTTTEWCEIHRHAEIGYRILSSVNEFSAIAEYVLAHHERWDGQGYPKGLRAEEIPVKARIISIADSYDAMTSNRTYMNVLSIEEAASVIKNCSGTQFDPDIARIFVENILGMPWEG